MRVGQWERKVILKKKDVEFVFINCNEAVDMKIVKLMVSLQQLWEFSASVIMA